jgi:hypothetical protein
VFFNTSPKDTPTHWKQTVMYLPATVPAAAGDLLCGELAVTRPSDNPRGLALGLTCRIISIEGGTGPDMKATYSV